MSLVPLGGGGVEDAETMRLIADWKDAKRNKDYARSDRIRADLQARGIDAEQTVGRPGDWKCEKCGAVVYASKERCFKCGTGKPVPVEQIIQAWKAAKAARDYATSDRLRAELQERGVDAEQTVARAGDWKCSCGAIVYASKPNCFKCGKQKPDNVEKITQDFSGGGGGGGSYGGGGGYGGGGSYGGGGGGRGPPPPPGPPPDDRLPPGWAEHEDQHYRRKYWHNDRTGETTWTRPTGGPQRRWEKHTDPSTRRDYWHDPASGETTWYNPY